MDNHYNIKRDLKPLTDEQINKHKNFAKLIQNSKKVADYKQFVRKPFYKNWGLYSFLIATAVVCMIILLEKEGEDEIKAGGKNPSDSSKQIKKNDTRDLFVPPLTPKSIDSNKIHQKE